MTRIIVINVMTETNFERILFRIITKCNVKVILETIF